jgi:hypothetical protein
MRGLHESEMTELRGALLRDHGEVSQRDLALIQAVQAAMLKANLGFVSDQLVVCPSCGITHVAAENMITSFDDAKRLFARPVVQNSLKRG